MFPRRTISIALLLLALGTIRAQQPIGIAYYDLDRLYDTIPALFYNDEAYTPDGKLGWNTERYARKINHTAAVVDSMHLPLIALYGVENEAVVRDIVTACREDYSYLHSTMNSLDGMDFALLYYGDLFYPSYTEQGRSYLYIEGTLCRDTIGLVLSHDTRYAEWAVRDLRSDRPHVKLLVLGRSSSFNAGKYGLNDATAQAARAGRGNVRYRSSGWRMRDRILADTAFRIAEGDVFARRYLFDDKGNYPLSTYTKHHYTGGYSFALPVFVYIR